MNFALLKSGDDDDWLDAGEELIPFCRNAAYYQCSGLSWDEADGVAIQVLTEAIGKILDFESEERFRGFLFDCAKKRACDVIRMHRRHKHFLSRAESIDLQKDADDEVSRYKHDPKDENAELPSDALLKAESREIANAALDALPTETRTLLREAILEELPHKDIAERHGWQTNTVGNRINQATTRAKRLLSSDERLKPLLDAFV